MAKRTEALKRAQNKYEAEKVEAGEHVQMNLKLKTRADLDGLKRVEAAFPHVPRARLLRLAWQDFVKQMPKGKK